MGEQIYLYTCKIGARWKYGQRHVRDVLTAGMNASAHRIGEWVRTMVRSDEFENRNPLPLLGFELPVVQTTAKLLYRLRYPPPTQFIWSKYRIRSKIMIINEMNAAVFPKKSLGEEKKGGYKYWSKLNSLLGEKSWQYTTCLHIIMT